MHEPRPEETEPLDEHPSAEGAEAEIEKPELRDADEAERAPLYVPL